MFTPEVLEKKSKKGGRKDVLTYKQEDNTNSHLRIKTIPFFCLGPVHECNSDSRRTSDLK